MKIRQGFVSNSSSSSFVIAFKNPKPCEHCGRSDPDIIKTVEDNSEGDYGETNVKAVGVGDVVEEIKHWYGIGTEHMGEKSMVYFSSIASKIDRAINDGFDVAIINVSYHNNFLNGILENDTDTLRVLESSG